MDEKRGAIAWKLDQQIKDNELKRRMLLIENAKHLSTIYEEGYYKELLGFEDSEWAGYLADLEVFYSRNKVNSYVTVYRKLTGQLKIEPEEWVHIPMTRLMDIVSILTEGNVDDWLAKASILTSKDWKIELRKAKGQVTEDEEHIHDDVDYSICRVCGRKCKLLHDKE